MKKVDKQNEITVKPLTVACSLAAVAFLLIGLSVGGQFLKYVFGYTPDKFLALFDLSLELNIPTFFSLLLLLFASFLLAGIALLQAKEKNPDVQKWVVLSLGFLYLAYDDGFHVHEDLVAVIRPLLGDGRLGIFYYAWIVPAIPLLFVLALFFRKFLFRLPPVTRNTFIVAALCYLGGCIGFEMVGGYYDEAHGGFDSLPYNMISTVEEGLEMTGVIVFIYALLEYVGASYGVLRFRLLSSSGSPDLQKSRDSQGKL